MGMERLQIMIPPETMDALKYKAQQDGVSSADLLRAGAAMVLGYCPTCLRPLERNGEAAEQ